MAEPQRGFAGETQPSGTSWQASAEAQQRGAGIGQPFLGQHPGQQHPGMQTEGEFEYHTLSPRQPQVQGQQIHQPSKPPVQGQQFQQPQERQGQQFHQPQQPQVQGQQFQQPQQPQV